jgi:hypothetical protein
VGKILQKSIYYTWNIHIKNQKNGAFLNVKGNPLQYYVAVKSLDHASLYNFCEISIYGMAT